MDVEWAAESASSNPTDPFGHTWWIGPRPYVNNLVTHRIEPDLDRAPIVASLFEWYASGEYSLKALTQKAAAEGLTNRTGGSALVKAKIHQLLQNPVYYGEFYWLGQLHHGLHSVVPLSHEDR